MKKYAIILALACLALVPANAQEADKYTYKNSDDNTRIHLQDVAAKGGHGRWDFYVTPRVGAIASDITGLNGKIKVGFVGGANVEVFILPTFAVDFELDFAKVGTNSVSHTNKYGNTASYDYRFLYLNTNYLARWYPTYKSHLSLYAGIEVSRLLKAKAATGGTISDIKSQLRSGDVSVPVGVSYEFGNWQADLRYSFGFTRVARSDKAREIIGKGHLHSLMLTMGYRIHIW